MRPTPSGGWRRGFGVAPYSRSSNVFTGSRRFTNPSYAGSSFRRRFYPPRRYPFAAPLSIPYFWNSDYQPDEESAASAPDQASTLDSQVGNLTDEVESLREEQASRQDLQSYAVAPHAAVREEPVPTILVYRDGHRGEVQNYAIMGQTLWIFSGQTTRRISLADLDLQATKKLNGERGVDFVSPD